MECSVVTLAYTMNPEDTHFQIQLCPWFVRYGMTVDYPTTNTSPKVGWDVLKIKLILLLAKFYTPIDIFSLSDKLMLHEVLPREFCMSY